MSATGVASTAEESVVRRLVPVRSGSTIQHAPKPHFSHSYLATFMQTERLSPMRSSSWGQPARKWHQPPRLACAGFEASVNTRCQTAAKLHAMGLMPRLRHAALTDVLSLHRQPSLLQLFALKKAFAAASMQL